MTKRDRSLDQQKASANGSAAASSKRTRTTPRRSTGPEAIANLNDRLRRDRLTRMAIMFFEHCSETHLKDLVVDEMDDQRRIVIGGHELTNFGSDSFLGLDRDPRVQQAIVEAVGCWGTHNGASRAFSSVELCERAERRLADWLGVEDTLIFPSVTLANVGLIPAVAGEGDLLVVDRLSHDSIHQGAKIAAADGATLKELHPCHAATLDGLFEDNPHDGCVVTVDGVYSMTGKIPPLVELDEVVRRRGGILYIDDAHGTGVVGKRGRGAAEMVLGSLDGVLMVGSLSKAFSCMGAFVTCTPELKDILKLRSSTYIFGGPVPPPYLAAVCAVCDILDSPEGEELIGQLQSRVHRVTNAIRRMGLTVMGGEAPIVSVTIGEIEQTLEAGKWLFDRGYYVQSATYPAVPINAGVLRIQVNANHSLQSIDGLLTAMEEMQTAFKLPVSNSPAIA